MQNKNKREQKTLKQTSYSGWNFHETKSNTEGTGLLTGEHRVPPAGSHWLGHPLKC